MGYYFFVLGIVVLSYLLAGLVVLDINIKEWKKVYKTEVDSSLLVRVMVYFVLVVFWPWFIN